MATNSLVKFAGVQKTYDGIALVVRDLNLDIQSGEFLSLLGPSGSGKTTTLMMLAGFESPTAGEIFLSGASITRTPPHKRNFGMVFQNYALFPHMTVRKNLAADRDAKVKRALEMVQMGGMGSRYPGQMSGGQQQRVALARALVFDPQLVLMDEPLGALDKQLREHMQIELKELHRQLGLTFVYVTHDQSEALTMSDRVAVFNDGAIQQIDVVTALYEAPANRFVANFVGDNTVFNGTVTTTVNDRCEVRLPCGTQLQGLNVNGVHTGTAVQACLRPERIVVHTVDEKPCDNSIRAVLNDVIYFGDHLRLRCALMDQVQATVKIPLWLHLPPEHLRVYR